MFASLADLVLVHGDVGGIRVYRGVLLQEFIQFVEIRLFQQFFDFECRFVQDNVQILDKMRVGIYLFPVSRRKWQFPRRNSGSDEEVSPVPR